MFSPLCIRGITGQTRPMKFLTKELIYMFKVKWAEEKMHHIMGYSVAKERGAGPLPLDVLLGSNFSGLISLSVDLTCSVGLLRCRLLNVHTGTFLDWSPFLCRAFCCTSINYYILSYCCRFFRFLTFIKGSEFSGHQKHNMSGEEGMTVRENT